MPREYVELMEQGGCQVVSFRPIGPFGLARVNNRNHRRILVVDGRIGFTGGSGVSSKWMGNGRVADHWRDTDIQVEGPAVEYLQGAFAENWVEATGAVLGGVDYFPRPIEPKGRTHAQVIRSGPGGGSYAMYTTFLLALSSARRSIKITNPYVLLDETMTDTLIQAARRDVRVSFLVPGVSDHPLVRHAGRRQFGRLLEAGIEIHEYTAALLHAKTMVIDGTLGHGGQHEPRPSLVQAERRAERGGVRRGRRAAAGAGVRGRPAVRETDRSRQLAGPGSAGTLLRAAGNSLRKRPLSRPLARYQEIVWPGLRIATCSSRPRCCASRSSRSGGSRKGSRLSSNVPQCMGTRSRPRTSSYSWTASSGFT